MSSRLLRVAVLLFGSGFCALVFQTVWIREFRLIFGASTAASAAALAIFMGGLGAGSIFLGRKSDRSSRPLRMYGRLELFIALSAAITPFLILFAFELYTRLGGSMVLGLGGATVVRLLLAALVLAVPTFLMGGTLPAATRAVTSDADAGRKGLSFLYGANALGAVVGVCLSTFVLLEALGNRGTLWLACVLNLAVSLTALRLSRSIDVPVSQPTDFAEDESTNQSVSPVFVYVAAAFVGFAFFLMEMVWYRMLSPILGGSVFTFGVILAVALFGIGFGGVVYGMWGRGRSPTVAGFSLTCAMEAAFIAFPYAMGDRLAFLALYLRPGAGGTFAEFVGSWVTVTAIAVLPAAFIAGVQFPLLIGLLGRGRRNVGRHLGYAYAWNTFGAIAGSLAGGFGLLPLLTAPGVWRWTSIALAGLGLLALVLSGIRRERKWLYCVLSGYAAAMAIVIVFRPGPTAVWRHSGIGAGRAEIRSQTPNGINNWARTMRQTTMWEAEGVESSIGLRASSMMGLGVINNGKSDGSARGDAGTQIMGGLIGALLHPEPKRTFVVGLGTGTTAGWYAKVPGMERVDVVELEPAVVEAAKWCAPANQNALKNEKISVQIGDAREVLLTSSDTYDIIFSEPSNPYRAGVSSLFTQEFYRAAQERLAAGGLFLQWMQAYEVDEETIQTVFATLLAVFPHVEVWQTQATDLLFVASVKPIEFNEQQLRRRLAKDPYRAAMSVAWRAVGIEGLLSRYVANGTYTRWVVDKKAPALNTDDQMLLEFAAARTVGRKTRFIIENLHREAEKMGMGRPTFQSETLDWTHVEDQRGSMYAVEGTPPILPKKVSLEQRSRMEAKGYYAKGNLRSALTAWQQQPLDPRDPLEELILSEALADAGDESANKWIDRLRLHHPIEADAVLARLRWRQGKLAQATELLEAAFDQYQHVPWPLPAVMLRAVSSATVLATQNKMLGHRLYRILRKPFAVSVLDANRKNVLVSLAIVLDFKRLCGDALSTMEPDVSWIRPVLEFRHRCYRDSGHPLAELAEQELDAFMATEEWSTKRVRKIKL